MLQGESDFVELEETACDTEDLLQDLIAKFTSLVPGDQVDLDTPRGAQQGLP